LADFGKLLSERNRKHPISRGMTPKWNERRQGRDCHPGLSRR
jgi:hypothetical protein